MFKVRVFNTHLHDGEQEASQGCNDNHTNKYERNLCKRGGNSELSLGRIGGMHCKRVHVRVNMIVL